MDLGLRDRVYLVTGGSRGLGFAAAQALVADGARVMISAPHEATAASAVARLAADAAGDVAGWIVADNGDPDEVRARLSERIPLRRYGEQEEFGRTAAFVLSPAASYITGAMIPVDGGAISSI